jgi:hypothetical protein
LIGKTKKDLLSCIGAGFEPKEQTEGDLIVLRFYKEASILEESFPAYKSSVPRAHHGCWATLYLKDDRVTKVDYKSVPKLWVDDDHCDEIFVTCAGQ